MALFAKKAVVSLTTEIDRVLQVPRRPPVDCDRTTGAEGRVYSARTQALIEVETDKYAITRAPLPDGRPSCACESLGFRCITQFNAMQAWWLRELSKQGGGVGFAGVGSGKTYALLLSILATPASLGVLFIKADQRLHYRKAWSQLRQHFKVPQLVFDDNSPRCESPGMPVLHIFPYSKLARPESTAFLESVKPKFIGADEMHKLSGDTVTTRRFKRFMADYEQDVIFCGASGSLITKSIKNVAYLMAFSLGHGSPYPIDPDEADAWAAVVDPSPMADSESATAKMLYKEFGQVDKPNKAIFVSQVHRVREGFQRRLVETPGIITTRSSAAPCSLSIQERKVLVPEKIKAALEQVRGYERPDGEELVLPMEQVECAKNVGAGFYFHWAWPGGEPEEDIDEWFAARKLWNKELRSKIMSSGAYLDSPKLCEDAARRAWDHDRQDGCAHCDGSWPCTQPTHRPAWRAATWRRWAAIKDRVEHVERVAWLDDFLVRDAAEWATKNCGIVWCLSSDFGRKIAERAGISYHAGGPGAEARILAEKGHKSIVATIPAHGQGRDGLQYKFSKQLITELPAGGDVWEQLLGRLCRQGQPADEVETFVYLHVRENKDALRKAIHYAEFTQAMTPNEQLLLAADMDIDL